MALNVLTGIANNFQAASSGWAATAQHYAFSIFSALAALEFAYAGITWVLRRNDLPEFLANFTLKILGLAFFYTMIYEAPTWAPAIIHSFMDLGGRISGAPVTLDPSAVVSEGVNIAAAMINSLSRLHIFDEIEAVIPVTIAALLVLIAFTIVAIQLLLTLVESYLIIGAGIVMLGFTGSRWTVSWGEKYFAYAVSIGIKLLVLELLIGLGGTLAAQWAAEFTATTLPVSVYFSVATASLVYGAMAAMAPGLAGSFMNGAPNMSLGSVGGTAAAVVGGTAAAGAMAVSSAAAAGSMAAGTLKAAGTAAAIGNSATGGLNGIGAAFQAGSTAAGDGPMGVVAGLGAASAQIGRGVAAASRAVAGAAWGQVQEVAAGTAPRANRERAQRLGGARVQGWGEGTAGGHAANRMRAAQLGGRPPPNDGIPLRASDGVPQNPHDGVGLGSDGVPATLNTIGGVARTDPVSGPERIDPRETTPGRIHQSLSAWSRGSPRHLPEGHPGTVTIRFGHVE